MNCTKPKSNKYSSSSIAKKIKWHNNLYHYHKPIIEKCSNCDRKFDSKLAKVEHEFRCNINLINSPNTKNKK